jgi:hypothetical protein
MVNLPRRVAALAACMIVSCAPAVSVVAFNPEAQPVNDPTSRVQMFGITAPKCQFVEIGKIRARRRTFWQSSAEVLEAMRVEVRKRGGDAIVAFSDTREVVGATVSPSYAGSGAEVTAEKRTVFTGTVVRFKDRNCME